MKPGLVSISAFLFLSANVYAQKGNIKGVILDKTEGLPGVSVNMENKAGTLTDIEGSFKLLDIDTGIHVIHTTYMGYADKDIQVRVIANETVDVGSIGIVANNNVINEVKIVGNYKQGGQSKAINMTKTSVSAISVLSSENIGKLPDKNAADAIQRVPGATVQKDKGEGSNVSLRGTPVDWTATLINGNRLPVADEENVSRVFGFEVFPASLIDYIVINRTITPDMEGDNIGGVINFQTKKAVTEKTFKLDLAGGYNLMGRKPSFNGNFVWGNISKNQKFSYIVNGSYYSRNYSADAPLVAYGTNFNHSLARYELKKYDGTRQTIGFNTAATYKVNDNLKLGGEFIIGRLIDDKHQKKMSYNWSDGSGARIRLQNIEGQLNHQLFGGELTAEWKWSDRLKVEGSVASYYNQFSYGSVPFSGSDPRNGYFTVDMISPLLEYTDKINTNFFGGAFDPNNAKDPRPYPYKMLDIDNPYGTGGDPYNNIQPKYHQQGAQDGTALTPNDYYLSSAYTDLNKTWERDPIVAKMDLTYDVSNKLKLKAGFKYRIKEGERNISVYEWALMPGTGHIPLSGFQTEAYDPHNDYLKEWGGNYKGTFMPFFTNGQMKNFMKDYGQYLQERPMDTLNNNLPLWVGSHYKYTEKVAAGYIMADADISDKVKLTGGLRLELTDLYETSDTLVQDDYAKIGIRTEERATSQKYLAVSPSLNMLYTPNENNNIRAAISRSFHRPNFEETKPGYAIYNREYQLFTNGNPNLKPTYAINLDAVFEHYWGSKGMFSIGGYYKHITDHIFVTNAADETQSYAGAVIKDVRNAASSYVLGAEAMVSRKFEFLPGFWSGFGVDANIAYSYSRMQVPGRTIKQSLTEQTPVIANFSLFYEKGKVNTRLGMNYTGAYTTEVNMSTDPYTLLPIHDNTDYDIFMGSQLSMDYQFAFSISKKFSVYLEVNNILNTPYRSYIGVPERPIRTEYYRQKGMIGFKLNL